jgi:ATP diphosphatase
VRGNAPRQPAYPPGCAGGLIQPDDPPVACRFVSPEHRCPSGEPCPCPNPFPNRARPCAACSTSWPAAGAGWLRLGPEQDFASIAPYTIEEGYEVADAIARGPDFPALLDELGDLLFQVVYHAQMAEEAGRFGFAQVAEAISAKMVRRHPHVFGDEAARDAAAQTAAWETQKAQERAARAETGALAGIPPGLPALTRALKLTRRAARVGFDWPDPAAVLDKLEEEATELRASFRRWTGRGRPTRWATCSSCW